MNIRRIIKNKHFPVIVSLVLYIPYTIIDYLSIPSFMGSGLTISDSIIDKLSLVPGDGVISSLEIFIFFMVLPILYTMYIISIVIDNEKRSNKS